MCLHIIRNCIYNSITHLSAKVFYARGETGLINPQRMCRRVEECIIKHQSFKLFVHLKVIPFTLIAVGFHCLIKSASTSLWSSPKTNCPLSAAPNRDVNKSPFVYLFILLCMSLTGWPSRAIGFQNEGLCAEQTKPSKYKFNSK